MKLLIKSMRNAKTAIGNNYFNLFIKKQIEEVQQIKETKIQYKPQIWLQHSLCQSVANLRLKKIEVNFDREKVYFADGGHLSLDWLRPNGGDSGKPIVVVMHGMTGGSEEAYIRVVAERAVSLSYTCVCINNRGFGDLMTSPIPFIGLHFHQLLTALNRIHCYFPQRPFHFVGTSLGANYMLRFLLHQPIPHVKSLSLLSPPFDPGWVVDNMQYLYQKHFVKMYIQKVLTRHPQMLFWQKCNIIDIKNVKKSKTIRQFHQRVTKKILNLESLETLFEQMKVTGQQLQSLQVPTLIMFAKDDPMVGLKTLPLAHIQAHPQIKIILTEKGGHLCWFQGRVPKRWYPQPLFQFITGFDSSSS